MGRNQDQDTELDEERLERLEDLLDALPLENDPMSVSELDGFLTGVLA